MESFEFASLPRMSVGQLLTSYFLKAEEKKKIKFHLQIVLHLEPPQPNLNRCLFRVYNFLISVAYGVQTRQRANSPKASLAVNNRRGNKFN